MPLMIFFTDDKPVIIHSFIDFETSDFAASPEPTKPEHEMALTTQGASL
jgi:hypothetical protein